MFEEKRKVDKVEMVKRLIRHANYQKSDAIFKECQALGMKVNRIALDRFTDKLQLLDKAEQNKLDIVSKSSFRRDGMNSPSHNAAFQQQDPNLIPTPPQGHVEQQYVQQNMPQGYAYAQPPVATNMQQPAQHQFSTQELMHNAQQSVESLSNPKHTLSAQSASMNDIKKREAEITFELGALKIRENELLKELEALSKQGSGKSYMS